MFIDNLGECEHSLYLGCRECSICTIKEEERLRAKIRQKEKELEEKAEYERLLEKIERDNLSI